MRAQSPSCPSNSSIVSAAFSGAASSPAAARYLLQNPQITSQGDAGDGYTQFSLSLS